MATASPCAQSSLRYICRKHIEATLGELRSLRARPIAEVESNSSLHSELSWRPSDTKFA